MRRTRLALTLLLAVGAFIGGMQTDLLQPVGVSAAKTQKEPSRKPLDRPDFTRSMGSVTARMPGANLGPGLDGATCDTWQRSGWVVLSCFVAGP